MRFHHVGVIVDRIDGPRAFWTGLGYAASETFSDPIQKANIVLLARDGEPMIELVSPHDKTSPSYNWIERIKSGPFHTCFEVPSLDAAIADLKKHGFAVVMEPVAAIAFGGRRVCFTWGKAAGLLELLEQ